MTDESLGARLKSERLRFGKSQAEMGLAMGVERETWGRYELGKLRPGIDVLRAMAELGADVPYILTGQRAPRAADVDRDAYSAGLNPEEAALLDNYRHAGEAGRKAIREVGAALAQSSCEISKKKK